MLDRLQAARRRRWRPRSAVRLHGRPRPTGPSPQLRLEPQQGRSDPFTIQDLTSDPFIYLSGPRRGVYLQCRVLIEYDIRMKQSGDTMQDDDLPLINGAATFIDGAITNGTSLDGTDTSREASSSSSQRSGPMWAGRIPQEIKIFDPWRYRGPMWAEEICGRGEIEFSLVSVFQGSGSWSRSYLQVCLQGC